MGGRRLARRAAHALLVTTLALSAAAGLAATGAFAAEASFIKASPSPIPAGETLTVNGTVFGWSANCELVIDNNPVPESTCFVAKDTLTGSLTIPVSYAAGKHLITACSPQCPAPNTPPTRIAVVAPPLTASTTVDVEPAPAPSTSPVVVPPVNVIKPQLVAVPNVVGMAPSDATTALQHAGLTADDGTVPSNAHVSAQNPTAGARVKVRSGVQLTFVVPKPAKSTDYVPIAIAGGATLVVLIGVLVAARAFMRRRRRIARRWYYDHVRLASRPSFTAGIDEGSLHVPSVHMAVRDTRLQTCELEEAQ